MRLSLPERATTIGQWVVAPGPAVRLSVWSVQDLSNQLCRLVQEPLLAGGQYRDGARQL